VSSNVTVILVSREIQPDKATSYFPEPERLIEWRDARHPVEAADRYEIDPGTSFAGLVEIKLDQHDRPFMLVANASCGADSFVLVDNTPEDEAMLREHVGTTIAAILTVRRRVGQQYCHGSRYEIEPQFALAPLPHNPTVSDLRAMAPGTHFVVQGRFLRYYEVTPGEPTPDPKNTKTEGYLVVETPNGPLTLNTFRPFMKELQYEEGVLENLKYKSMIPGETIRITGFITRKQFDQPSGIITVGYNHPYLLVPDPQRQADYDALRVQVEIQLGQLQSYVEKHHWTAARTTFANLRKQELTRDEHRQVVAIMATVPADQRSVYTRHYRSERLEKAFQVNPETLNRLQFLEFAHKVITGEQQNYSAKGELADQSYLFDYWREDDSVLNDADQTQLVLAGIATRLERLERCSDVHDEYWDDRYLLTRCIEHIGYMDDPDERLVAAVVEMIDYCFEQKYFPLESDTREEFQCPQRLDDLLRTCFRSVEQLKRSGAPAAAVITRESVEAWKARLIEAEASQRYATYYLANVERFL